MNLKKILKNVDIIISKNIDENLDVFSVCDNSKKCTNNSMFVCINGLNTNGNNYYKEAIESGAKVIVTDNIINDNISQIVVKNSRKALSQIISNFYNDICSQLKIIGIVGTNGKTSTAKIIRHILGSANFKTGLIGTNIVSILDKNYSQDLTTPDIINLYKYLDDMVNEKVEYCIMEVSAHAIDLLKVEGIKFEALVFTNFSQDHLDYFKTMEHYKEIKKSIFINGNSKLIISNNDDLLGAEILNLKDKKRVSYGVKNLSDYNAKNIKFNKNSTSFLIKNASENFSIKTKLIGEFNIYNILCACSTVHSLGLTKSQIENGILTLTEIEGRFNSVSFGQIFDCIIDYAHTPESLISLLKTATSVFNKNLLLVFGCPGNRDEFKREQMGETAGKFCKKVFITTDNPLFENGIRVMRDIEKGVKKTKCNYAVIENRKLAIAEAFKIATKDNVVILAGKGTENYQNINGFKVPYNDYEVCKELLN